MVNWWPTLRDCCCDLVAIEWVIQFQVYLCLKLWIQDCSHDNKNLWITEGILKEYRNQNHFDSKLENDRVAAGYSICAFSWYPGIWRCILLAECAGSNCVANYHRWDWLLMNWTCWVPHWMNLLRNCYDLGFWIKRIGSWSSLPIYRWI